MNYIQKIAFIKSIKINPNLYSFLAFLVAFVSLVISWKNHYDLLPIHEARVIIPEGGIRVATSKDKCPDDNKPCFEVVEPLLKNIGESSANNVRFEFYGCFLDDNLKFEGAKWPSDLGKYDSSCLKYWDTILISDFPPGGEETHFGNSNIPLIHESDEKYGETYIGQPFVLIFYLEYFDDLTKKIKDSMFFYKYNIGEGVSYIPSEPVSGFSAVVSGSPASILIRDDFLKLYPRLVRELEASSTKNSRLIDKIKAIYEDLQGSTS